MNEWNHIAGTYNGSNQLQLYFNGNFVTAADTGGHDIGPGVTDDYLTFGFHSFLGGDVGSFTSVDIDDARIYNIELSSNEINSIYNKGIGNENLNNGSQLLFRGILETRSFEGEETNQNLSLTGRDYTARFKDLTVEPVTYTNSEISTIVTNIIQNEVPEITTNNVNATVITLPRIAFNHTTVFDALTQLAELANFVFYIDNNKDLHFEEKNSISSSLTFDNTNILSAQADTTRENFNNIIWVYGDRQLTTAPQHIFVQTAALGSVITLPYKPHNTQVRSSQFPAGSILKGGVFNMISPSSVSGLEYLVNFDDRQIIMVSGTTPGYSRIPPNGGSIVVVYDRSVPIAKFGQDNVSIANYGPKEKIIIDKNIKDPQTAKNILLTELQNSLPIDELEVRLKGWEVITPSNTAIINLPDFNLSGKTVGILEANYNFNPTTTQTEQVLSISLDNKMGDLTDQIVDLNKRLKKLEAGDTSDTDLITRLEFSEGSVLVVGSRWNVSIRGLGSSFILGVGPHGVTGPTFGGIIGSVVASGINFLGDSRSGLHLVFSGGYYF